MNTLDKARLQLRAMAYGSIRKNIGSVLFILRRRSFTPEFLRSPLYFFARTKCGYSEHHMIAYYPEIPDAAFIDIGASLGLYCDYMAPRCRRIYAFEPNPTLTKFLNDKAEALGNMEVHAVALGESNGTGIFHQHKLSGHGSLVRKAPDYIRSMEIPVRTLDSYDFEVPIGLIKIDTEGYDVNVLRGGLETIRKHRPRLIVEIHAPYNENRRAILQFLKDINYQCNYATLPDARFDIGHIVANSRESESLEDLDR